MLSGLAQGSFQATARAAAFAVAALSLSSVVPSAALAAPEAELWPRWQAHDPAATQTIDHTAWGRILRTYIVPDGGINYFAYGKVSEGDRAALSGYVDALANTPISRFGRDEQLAYWVNLYNALTIELILEHGPVKSIRDIDISPGLFSFGPWDKTLITVEGEALTLNDIEHRILRPIWRDPRIHYAVNCASIGCPNLQDRAFTGANAEALLEAGARAYINHPRGARVEGGALTVSSIYDWFSEDFGDDDAAIIAHLKRYAEPPLREALEGIREIDDDEYDWRLNAPGAASTS